MALAANAVIGMGGGWLAMKPAERPSSPWFNIALRVAFRGTLRDYRVGSCGSEVGQ
jgi:hypothetical protein